MQHENMNITSWDKPWIPELDWLNSYINLSSYDQNTLDGLAIGYKLSTSTRYMESSHRGCYLTFHWDAELADAYYFEHYNNTNKTMLLFAPNIPMRPDTFKILSKFYHLIIRMPYRPGLLKEMYQERDMGYLWSTYGGVRLRIALVAADLITIIGVFDKHL